MNDRVTLAVVGDRNSILVFHTLGMKTFPVETPQEAEAAIRALSAKPNPVIFITEQAAAMVPEQLARYKNQTYPAIIPIPNRAGTDGSGMQGIQENVKKAVGFNIFDEETAED